MAERHDIDDHIEPVDAHHLQRLRTPTRTGQGASGTGTDREQDPHVSALVARARNLEARRRLRRAIDRRASLLPPATSGTGGVSASESEVESVLDFNDPHMASNSVVSAKVGLAELRFALRQLEGENNASVRRAVEREYHVATKLFDCADSGDVNLGSDEEFVPGPVAAILLDRQIPDLAGEELAARVVQLLTATNHQTVRRGQRALAIAGAVILSVGVAATYVLAGAFSMLALMSLVSLAGMQYVIATGQRARYPRLDINDACALAYFRSGPAALLKNRPGTAVRSVDTSAPSDRQAISAEFAQDAGTAARGSRAPQSGKIGLRKPQGATPKSSASERERRITEVHAAVAELDTEWLEYRLDTHAWFLSKPQLRNDNDPVIATYREAQAELRDLADDLTSMSTDADITAAQRAARRALTAWGEANTHALKIGASDLSPSEEAALKRLHGLVNLLNDRSTPRAMWAELKDKIGRTMEKLTVTSFDSNVIADLPVISAESRLRALPAGGGA